MLSTFGQVRLVKDPELKEVNEKFSVAEFSVAVNDKVGKDKEATSSFFDCKAFNHTAKFITNYFKKGDGIMMVGTPKQERWEKDGQKFSRVIFMIDRVEFPLSKKSSNEESKGDESNEEIPF